MERICFLPGPKDKMAKEATERMVEISRIVGDTESAHVLADRLMCEILRSEGYGELVSIFEAMDRWYA